MDGSYGGPRPPLPPCPRASTSSRYAQLLPSCVCLAEVMQTALENEENIGNVVKDVQKIASALTSWMTTLSTSVSPELQFRISVHISYVPGHLVCDVPLTIYSILEGIRASTSKWTKQKRKLWRRLLDARRVAKELEAVMEEIHKANERFIVRRLHQRDDTAPLISSLARDYCED
jgi:hypothetical protein